MDIAILCAVAVLTTALTWLYISNRKPAPEELEDTQSETPEGQPALEQTNTEEQKPVVFHKPAGKQLAFLIAMLLGLCGIAVALVLIYERNTMVSNLKLITLLSILFAAAYVDAREKIIPNVLVLTGLALRVVFWIAELIVTPDTFLTIVKNDLTGCLLVVVFFIIGVLMMKGGLGMGDVKLMLVMCLFQGFYGVVSALFFSLFVVFVYAIIALIARKKSRKDSVAFGPAILLGTLVSVFLTGM